MTKIDIISGFLGAGKTTLIKKLIAECFAGEKLVLIENEVGEIGIDGGFMKEAGIAVSEINSGCICCSLVGDFKIALHKVVEEYEPDRIIIEPTGVGKLSDIIHAVQSAELGDGVVINSFTTVVDAGKAKMYMKNFGEFFNDQVEHAGCIIFSRSQNVSEEKLAAATALLREHNEKAPIITTPWDALDADVIRRAMESQQTALAAELASAVEEAHHVHEHHHHHHDDECGCHEHHHDDECGCHEHHHHHDDECGCHEHHHHHDDECGCHEHHHDDECGCHEHHHHDDECGCHEHHHHDDKFGCHEHHHHDDECGCHEHHHHHDDECGCHGHHHHDDECGCHEHHHHEHDEHCSCGCHDHHHHGHDADEVFTTWGIETPKKFERAALEEALRVLSSEDNPVGVVLRAKGIVECVCGKWLHFDLTPGEYEIREGAADYTGRLCVIGTKLDEDALRTLLGL